MTTSPIKVEFRETKKIINNKKTNNTGVIFQWKFSKQIPITRLEVEQEQKKKCKKYASQDVNSPNTRPSHSGRLILGQKVCHIYVPVR